MPDSVTTGLNRKRPDTCEDTAEMTGATSTAPPRAQTLTLWPLVALVFYTVSGGPFGIEPAVRAGGNFFALAGFVLFPLVWSLPEALVTAELGAAFQDPSAGVAWVGEAFGETTAYLCGYLGWISGATGTSILRRCNPD